MPTTVEFATPFPETIETRPPAYHVPFEFNRFRELRSQGLSSSAAESQLIKELTQARAAHAAEILLARGPEHYRREPYVLDIDDYYLAGDPQDRVFLARGPVKLREPVVEMLAHGVENAQGRWRTIASAVKEGMAQVETLLAGASPGEAVVLVSPPEMEAKAYSFVYLFQKTQSSRINGYAVPVWQEPVTLADKLTQLDADRPLQPADHLSLLRSPILVSDSLVSSPAQVFELFTGLDQEAFRQGIDHYHLLQEKIRPQVVTDLGLIEQGIGEALVSQSLLTLQKSTIFTSAGFEGVVAKLQLLEPGDILRLVLPCGVLELGPSRPDSAVSYAHSLITGSRTAELVNCPVCSQKAGRTVKVRVAVGHACPNCGQIRPRRSRTICPIASG